MTSYLKIVLDLCDVIFENISIQITSNWKIIKICYVIVENCFQSDDIIMSRNIYVYILLVIW